MIKKTLWAMLAAILLLTVGSVCAQDSGKGEKDKGIQFKKAKDVTEPVLVDKVNPAYPAGAKQDRVQGSVILDVTIGADGTVLDAKASKSPDERLSEAAVSAIKQWKFKPALTKAGKPVEVLASITVNFKLK